MHQFLFSFYCVFTNRAPHNFGKNVNADNDGTQGAEDVCHRISHRDIPLHLLELCWIKIQFSMAALAVPIIADWVNAPSAMPAAIPLSSANMRPV
ncbi:hypothetical protein [Pantoea sp. SORGH_AS_0659]|uniref:hypothetical protein n=1 Tax=Pantoea sp. SORGH_AS_0659 TaxID=3062597 RepID=UPI00285E4726|nr:hypothetical protein [Pantoea sp. SORGH_AS_0659]MDR6353197.1 hypothetical protein [Pantoea sp. SORGH_AS_0659]